MAARQLELLAVEIFLPLLHGAAGEFRHEQVQPDLAHRHQARVRPVARQCGVQRVQVAVTGLRHVQRVNAQRVAVAEAVGQRAHRVEIRHFHRRDHALRHPDSRRTRAHVCSSGAKLRRVEVAVRVDPGRHGAMMPEAAPTALHEDANRANVAAPSFTLAGSRMRKTALYSRSAARPGLASPAAASEPGATADPMPGAPRHPRWQFATAFLASPRGLWIAIGVLTFLLLLTLAQALRPGARALTQEDIDAAVLNTLEKTPLPSPAARAAEVIRPSVVRVTGYRAGKKGEEDIEHGVGTGVVIVDKGVILTNLHVVQAADTIKVLFADGLEATASITGAQPENDLAVLQAHKIPTT
jgi:hypothetical protein